MFRTIKWGQGFQKQSLKSKQNSRGFSFANNTVITFWVNLLFDSKLILGYSINVLSYYVCIKLFIAEKSWYCVYFQFTSTGK